MPADRRWLGIEPAPARRPTPPPVVDPLRPTEGWAASALAQECDAVRAAPVGERNATLNTAAFNLGQLLPEGHLDEAEVRARLTEAALEAGLGYTETIATIASGLGKGMEHPRGPKALEGPVSPQEGEVAPESRRIDWGALWADPGVQEWLCEPIVPAGRLVALYSPSGVGKSMLALELAVAISRGTHLLGVKCKRTPVLYLDYEMTPLDVRDRLQKMGLEPADLAGLHYEAFPLLPMLDTPMGGAALLAMAQECGAGLIVIDTISRATVGEENESVTWHNLYRCTLSRLKAAGIAVLRLDHTGKDEERGMRGSSAKVSDVDLVWRLEQIVKDDVYLLKCEKERIRVSEKMLNIERRSDPIGHHIDMRSVGEAKEEAILKALDDAGLPRDAGRDRARAVLRTEGIRVRDSTLAKILKTRQDPHGLLDE